MRKSFIRLRKSHKKDFQVSYQTLLFMAKVKEYAFDCCSMTEDGVYYNESLNDKAVDILMDIGAKANNFFLMPPLRRYYSPFLSMYLPAHSIFFKFFRLHMCPYNAHKTYQIWANGIYGAFTISEQEELIEVVAKSSYGNSEAISCANFAWRLLEEDNYIPIISDIRHIKRRLH